VSPVLEAPRTIRQALDHARGELRQAPFEPSPREATLLLGHLLGLGEAAVLARYEEPLDPALEPAYSRLMQRRLAGEPVAYLLSEREFYGRPFRVDGRVLVPRPETEHLVERALELDLPANPRMLDIGTGSGCIAATLALERPDARVVASDVSTEALALASRNMHHFGLDRRVVLLAMDLAAAARLANFDLVVSNPPYIDPADAPSLSMEVTAFEPSRALFAAQRGTSIERRLLTELDPLRPGCHLLMEIGAGQKEALLRAAQASPFDFVACTDDYAGIPRVLHFVRSSARGVN
jgi:release factor glutamine methyltransferase